MSAATQILKAALLDITETLKRTEMRLEAIDNEQRALLTKRANLNSEKADVEVALARLGVEPV